MNAVVFDTARRIRSVLGRLRRRLLGVAMAPAAHTASDLRGELDGLRTELDRLRSEVTQVNDALRSLRNELAGQISFLVHDMGGGASGASEERSRLSDQLTAVESALQCRLNEIHAQAFEARNGVIHIDSSVHSRLNELFNEKFPALLEQVHQTAVLAGSEPAWQPDRAEWAAPAALPDVDFAHALERARTEFSSVFEAWKSRLDETSAAFAVTKEGNAAYGGDLYSRLFRSFVRRHARGPLLDVGCGPFGLPFYLEGFPPEQFAGLEPLPANTADVQIVRGISEYLPWPDHSFATVISATSLDHCLSLDRSLAEVIRVLKPGGRFLLWIGSNPGSPPFRPLDPAFTPADQYHLFHFDTSWFEPLLSQSFVIEDRARFDRGSYSHVFYCLTPSQERPDARV